MQTSNAAEILAKYQSQINQSLENILPRAYTDQTLKGVVGQTQYQLDIEAINKAVNQPIWDLLDRGGKKWRPVLFLVIVELLGKKPEDFINLAAIFEVIHNATLIVDDLEDLSESRRGKPTLHLIYGDDVAINAGNTLYFLPIKILEKYHQELGDKATIKILNTYIDEMTKLSFGQATDIAWHKGLVDSFKITEAQYLQMCGFKTGGLARMATKIAALVGGADEKLVEALGKLGESLGVVFQIQDDILNITENELSKAKGLGEDITEGKRSLPAIYAFQNLPEEKAKRLNEILLMHTTERGLIDEAISLIQEAKGIEQSQKIMEKLFKDAWQELSPLIPDSPQKENLYNLANFLINRSI